jgi:hypothetical protein
VSEHVIPKIGFQGFGFRNKGIHRIALQVQSEFDEAIIRLHIPYSLFVDNNGIEARARVAEVEQIITKPGIKIEVSHDFKTEAEVVAWLNENTINCYFFDPLPNCGISSSIDYALAARRPIAITKSHMLVHLWNLKPSVLIEENSLRTIIANGIAPLEPLYEKYTQAQVAKDYENVCDVILAVPKEKYKRIH